MATYEAKNLTTGQTVQIATEPMEHEGEWYEAVDLEPESGYALYRDLEVVIAENDDIEVILRSADAYTEEA